MNKNERKQFLLSNLPWLIIPIFLLAVFILLAVFKWESGTTAARVILVISIVFAGGISVLLISYLLTHTIKSLNEEKVVQSGQRASAKIEKVFLRESTDTKSYSGVKINNLYGITISYSHPDTKKTKYYTFSKLFTRYEVNYLLSLEKINISTNGKACIIEEDLEKANSTPLEYLKDERITGNLRFGTKQLHKANSLYQFLYPFICFFIAIFLLITLNPEISVIPVATFVIIGATSLIRISFKRSSEKLIRKYGKKAFAKSFRKQIINPSNPEPDLSSQNYIVEYDFETENGNLRTTESRISAEDYAILDNMTKLPIIVYKDQSVIDYDEFSKI